MRRRIGRSIVLLAILLAARGALANDGNPQAIRRTYEIPALPLATALARYSEASGVDVLLRDRSTGLRSAAAVHGRLTPPEALAALLQGSGLVARFTSARSAVIVPVGRADEPWTATSDASQGNRPLLSLDLMHVTAPRVIGAPPRSRGDELFAEVMAGRIRNIVTDRSVMVGGKPAELRIVTRIGSDGALYDVHVVQGSTDPTVDVRVVALLQGAQLGLIPPQGLRQPLLFDVSGR